jgi:hypothetical protein
MKRLLTLLMLLAWTTSAGAIKDPKFYFPASRTTLSGGTEVLTSSNATIWGYKADGDTAACKKACVYVGGPKKQWCFVPDSTDTYMFIETTGTDSALIGMDAVPLFGPGLAPGTGSVATKAFADSVYVATGYIGQLLTDSVYSLGEIVSEAYITALAEMNADSMHAVQGGWWEHRGKIGSGGASDRLTVDGGLTVTGSSILATLTASGTMNFNGAKTIIGDAVTDSACGFGAWNPYSGYLKLGTNGRAASLVLSDGASKTVSYSINALAVSTAPKLPVFMVADTVALKTTRTLWGDRTGSKYVAGARAGDRVVMGTVGAAPSTLTLSTKTDSLVVTTWPSAADNKVLDFFIVRQ